MTYPTETQVLSIIFLEEVTILAIRNPWKQATSSQANDDA